MVGKVSHYIRALNLTLGGAIMSVCGMFVWGLTHGDIGATSQPSANMSIISPHISIPPVDSNVLTHFDLFYKAQKSIQPTEQPPELVPETTLNLIVFGMRADLNGGSSSAIIQTPDNKQASYYIGEEIIPGVVLTRVDINYVILNRNGQIERLTRLGITKPDVKVASRVGESVAEISPLAPETLSFKAYDFINDLRFYKAKEGRKVLGFKVRSRQGMSLAQYGLERNDIVTSINGQDLTQLRVNLPNLFKNLKVARYATIQIMRDDVPMVLEVNLQ